MLLETPQWLLDLYPGKQFYVGAYAYLDGELHVKVSLAMDGIIRDLTNKRKVNLVGSILLNPANIPFGSFLGRSSLPLHPNRRPLLR